MQQLIGAGNIGPVQLGVVTLLSEWRYCNSLTGCGAWNDDANYQNLVYSRYNNSAAGRSQSYRYLSNRGMQFYLSVSPTQFVLQSGWTYGSSYACTTTWDGITSGSISPQGALWAYDGGSNTCDG